jgi:hypothetical protein
LKNKNGLQKILPLKSTRKKTLPKNVNIELEKIDLALPSPIIL